MHEQGIRPADPIYDCAIPMLGLLADQEKFEFMICAYLASFKEIRIVSTCCPILHKGLLAYDCRRLGVFLLFMLSRRVLCNSII